MRANLVRAPAFGLHLHERRRREPLAHGVKRRRRPYFTSERFEFLFVAHRYEAADPVRRATLNERILDAAATVPALSHDER